MEGARPRSLLAGGGGVRVVLVAHLLGFILSIAECLFILALSRI